MKTCRDVCCHLSIDTEACVVQLKKTDAPQRRWILVQGTTWGRKISKEDLHFAYWTILGYLTAHGKCVTFTCDEEGRQGRFNFTFQGLLERLREGIRGCRREEKPECIIGKSRTTRIHLVDPQE